MDAAASKFLFLALLSILFANSSGSFDSLLSGLKVIMHTEPEQTMHSYHRELIQTIQHDFMNPPITTFPNPTTPLTNPVTTPNPATVVSPPNTLMPPLDTIPPANPITAIPTPLTDPINPPIPVTNPVTTPSTTIPVGPPATNPVTNPSTTIPVGPSATNPVTTPSTTIPVGPPATNPGTTPINAPAVSGQSWCVARGGLPETALQVALDYACGIGGADCSAIQQGASCYNPNTMQNHASYAFNSYYQRNPGQTSCDFGGTAMITNVNPSTGSCVFTTLSSSSASPATTSPLTYPIPTPNSGFPPGAMPAGFASPPNILGATNPALGGGIAGYGESPPTASISSATMSSSFQPYVGCTILVISIITGRIVFDI